LENFGFSDTEKFQSNAQFLDVIFKKKHRPDTRM
jgi:hypothetical protein